MSMQAVSPFLYLLLTAALAVVGGGMILTSVKAHWTAACTRCGYDLRGHGDQPQCPECGQPFEAVPHGYIERRHFRFICGIALMCLAMGAFCLMFFAMIR